MSPHRPGWWILALALIVLVLPLALRFFSDKPVVPGSESYGHLRVAEFIAANGIPEYDPALPERSYRLTLLDALLVLAVKLSGAQLAALIIPLLLGMLTAWCAVRATQRWGLRDDVALASQLVFVLSPFFVDVFAQVTMRGLELFLLALLLLALAPDRKPRTALRSIGVVLSASALATFGIVPALLACLLPLLAGGLHRRPPVSSIFASSAAVVVSLTIAVPAFLAGETPRFAAPLPVINAISDFGSAGGLSLFALLLSFIGLVLAWKLKKRHYSLMIATTAILILSLFLPSALVAAHVVVAVLAGTALAFFAAMRWSFADIRNLTLLVLLCGLLFATLAHAVALAKGQPTREMQEGAQALRGLPGARVVLAHPDDGFWIAYWSGKQVFLDGWLAQIPGVNGRWAKAQAIWHSQEMERALPLLEAQGIGAVVVTQPMRQGGIWELPDQDFLLLVQNNETFKSIYGSSSVDIWALRPEISR